MISSYGLVAENDDERRITLKEIRFSCISASILSVCTRLCKGSNWTVWSLNSCNASCTALLLMRTQLKNASILILTVAPGFSLNRMFPFVGTVCLLCREVGFSISKQRIHCIGEVQEKLTGVTVRVSLHQKNLPRKASYSGYECVIFTSPSPFQLHM